MHTLLAHHILSPSLIAFFAPQPGHLHGTCWDVESSSHRLVRRAALRPEPAIDKQTEYSIKYLVDISDKTGQARPWQVRSDQSDQQDRGSARLPIDTLRQPPSLGCLSDRTASHTSRIGKPVETNPGGAPRVTHTVTQAQDTDRRWPASLPACQTHPIPSHAVPSSAPVCPPSSSLPSLPLDPLLLFCYTYFYFVPILVPRLLASSPLPVLPAGSKCLRAVFPPFPCAAPAAD